MKVKFVIIQRQEGTMEVGKMPVSLIRDLLKKNDGTFDGNWSVSDVSRDEKWTTESVEVEEVP